MSHAPVLRTAAASWPVPGSSPGSAPRRAMAWEWETDWPRAMAREWLRAMAREWLRAMAREWLRAMAREWLRRSAVVSGYVNVAHECGDYVCAGCGSAGCGSAGCGSAGCGSVGCGSAGCGSAGCGSVPVAVAVAQVAVRGRSRRFWVRVEASSADDAPFAPSCPGHAIRNFTCGRTAEGTPVNTFAREIRVRTSASTTRERATITCMTPTLQGDDTASEQVCPSATLRTNLKDQVSLQIYIRIAGFEKAGGCGALQVLS